MVSVYKERKIIQKMNSLHLFMCITSYMRLNTYVKPFIFSYAACLKYNYRDTVTIKFGNSSNYYLSVDSKTSELKMRKRLMK